MNLQNVDLHNRGHFLNFQVFTITLFAAHIAIQMKKLIFLMLLKIELSGGDVIQRLQQTCCLVNLVVQKQGDYASDSVSDSATNSVKGQTCGLFLRIDFNGIG